MRRWLIPGLLCVALVLSGCAGRRPQTAPPVPAPVPVAPQPQPAPEPLPPPVVAGPCSPLAPAPQPGMTRVDVYFTCSGSPRPVPRLVPDTPGVLKAALEELLKGPTEQEKALGFTSWFSPATAGMLRSVALDSQGHATVDFANFSRIIPNASTSAGSQMLTGELKRTVFQFPTVRTVEFRFAGNCTAFWEWLQSACTVLPAPPAADLALQDRADRLILALKQADWTALSAYVHPRLGVRFSPYGYVHAGQDGDRVFTAAQVKAFPLDSKTYEWGTFDGSGQPIAMSTGEYYRRFIYDHDFAEAPQVEWDRRIGQGNTLFNLTEVYPGGRFVEYHFPGFEAKYQGMDWRSLRLVFQAEGGTWYLVGIVHDEWTI